MNVGLVHDYLLVMRGAERTFAAMADLWPSARIYTTLYDPEGTEQRFSEREVRTTFLQRVGARQQHFRRLLPLFPIAVERLPVAGHDVLVSSSSAWAHGVRPAEGAVHVCYCHTPFRYATHERATALAEVSRAARPLASVVLDAVRAWDTRASERVTHYVANSEITKARIAERYGRDSTIIHPPVAVHRFEGAEHEPEDWFLIVCELVAHKRVDRALEAARRAGKRVRVVGDGPESERWRATYSDVADFLGRVSDEELDGLYGRAAALLVPNVEEFGIAAVEAQAAGRPVLATDAGGARETVVSGRTGERVDGSVDSLAEAMRDVDWHAFDRAAVRANARRFSETEFKRRMREHVDAAVHGAAASSTSRSNAAAGS